MVAKSQEKQTLEHADWWNCALISQLTGFLSAFTVPFQPSASIRSLAI
jgi:hypothetical protein